MRLSAARLVVAVVALLAVSLLVLAFRPRPERVEVAVATSGPMRVAIEVEGKARVRDRYVVGAPVAGRLARIVLREGDRVVAGAVVARIDPLPARAAVDEARARIDEAAAQRAGVPALVPKQEALAQAAARIASAESAREAAAARTLQARAAWEQSLRERERARALAATGDLARSARESAELQAESRRRELDAALLGERAARNDATAAGAALAELEAKRHDADHLYAVYDAQIAAAGSSLRSLSDDASRTLIRAPVSGRVLRVAQQSESAVTAGAPLIELADTRALEMVFDVLSSDAVGIRPGATVTVLRGAGERELSGRVRRVEPSAFTKVSALGVEEQRVNVVADFEAPPQGLGDLYRVEARITEWSAADATQIPIGALVRCGEAWCAYAVERGRARRRTLDVGHRNDEVAELRGGLRRGEAVVVHPSDRVADGTRVSVSSEEPD